MAEAYTNASLVHPLAVVLFVVFGGLAMVSRPATALALVLGYSFFVVPSQRVMVGSIDMPFYRIIGILLLLRFFSAGALQRTRLERADAAIILFFIFRLAFASVRGGSMMNALGEIGDLTLYYALGRFALSDRDSLVRFITAMAVFMPIIAGFIILEKSTSRNLFSIYGGVFEYTPIRFGKLRAQAAFVHPIIAGVIFGTLIPLFIGARFASAGKPLVRTVHGIAILSASICVFATASSTPLLAMFGGLAFLAAFPWRRFFPMVAQVGIVLGLLIHLLSNGGLHHLLFARLSFVTGSTGYHRYLLWDSFLDSFSSWFLIGKLGLTSGGVSLVDVTCQYIAVGLQGGIVLLALFLYLLWQGAKSSVLLVRSSVNPSDRFLSYTVGAWVFSNVLAFSAVTYFGQGVSVFAIIFGGAVAVASNAKRLIVFRPLRERGSGLAPGSGMSAPASFR